MNRQKGVILPVILMILVLLGLLAATFGLRVHSDLAATQAQADMLQTRLAAEAGVERIKMLLREAQLDSNRWFNNPDELHRVIVWSEGGDATLWGKNDELDEGTPAFRFSIVADDAEDDEHFIRFGITDESSRLNLNKATATQLMALIQQVVAGDESVDPQAIVDAIMDWRDADQTPIGEDGDTEGDYYESLDPPYRVKNGPFDTVEELLLVKGITGSILYGEDFDRNGLLTPNEDDGDKNFPDDNQDGKLNRGLYPYLTVLSVEDNVSNDRRPRVSLAGSATAIREQLESDFPGEPDVIEFLATVGRSQTGRRGPQAPRGGTAQPGGRPTSGGRTSRPSLHGPSRPGRSLTPPGGANPGGAAPGAGGTGGAKTGSRQQRRQNPVPNPAIKPPKAGQGNPPGQNPGETEEPLEGLPGGENPQTGDREEQPADGTKGSGQESGEAQPPAEGQEGQESTHGTGGQQSIRSPASLLLLKEQPGTGQPLNNPLKLEHLAVLMDRTTVLPQNVQKVQGLVNINTAPREVLRCLDGLTENDIEAIIAKRVGLDATTKATTAWLVTEEAVSLETFDAISAQITARGQQFAVESLGYADHLGTVTRLQVVLDMMGPVPQTVYYRDATYLGGHFPIREEDKERVGAR